MVSNLQVHLKYLFINTYNAAPIHLGYNYLFYFIQDILYFKVYCVLVSSANLWEVNPWG